MTRDPVTIVCLGEPLGFARTRPNRLTGQPFTPRPQRNAAVILRFEAANVMRDSDAPMFDEPIRLDLTAEFSIPASWSKKKQAAALAGLLRPTRKPDLSNVLKLVEDALNSVVYRDDVQICEIFCRKVFSQTPKLVLTIHALDAELPLRSAVDKMKRRAVEARRSVGGCDHAPSQTLAEDYRDSPRENQDRPLISEDGQPVSGRVGLPRSRRP